MRAVRAWFHRCFGLFHKRRSDAEFAAELESHLQLHIEDNLRAGMTPEAARRDALLKLGGVEQTKENYRHRRGLPFLETLFQDLRFGLRLLRLSPAFTLVALLSLALGIGANTAIFQIIDTLRLRTLPVKNPQELAIVRTEDLNGFMGETHSPYPELSFPLFEEIRHRQQAFSAIAAWGADRR